MSEITILNKPAEEIGELDQTFDLVYLDPPFGLQRDFNMVEEDGREKGFSDSWESFDDYIHWYANIVIQAYYKLDKNGWMYLHNNFIGNALVYRKLHQRFEIISIQIYLGRGLAQKIISRMGGEIS